MTNAVRELYEKAFNLSDQNRAELAALLLESLDPVAEPGVEEAWAREIERRLAAYEAGDVQGISWAELRAQLHRGQVMLVPRFFAEAGEEIEKERDWYRKRSEAAEAAFLKELDHAIEVICEAPQRWPTHIRYSADTFSPPFPSRSCISGLL